MQTLLGFDFGTQRIGIAVGQSITGTATALCTINSRNGKPDWDRITELIDCWRPDALVIGLPLHNDGSDSDISKAVRKFMQQLEEHYGLPVHTMDERLSSHTAKQYMKQSTDKQEIDAVAAMIILQNWLEARKHE
ncbi:MAG: Holliday junction resolvase RuvX [Pseudomonadota bacterium]